MCARLWGRLSGEVCCHVTGAEQINSKISHHLKELRLAGLITVERRGKNMICGVNREAVAALAAYLGGDVCRQERKRLLLLNTQGKNDNGGNNQAHG